ncbi:ribosomal lysine N-methyltransferase 4-like isoform X3 [Triticum dicoccoides]|uniref:ribosomal lysine N-methyltransferase 4-like isoform X3 n=1 Tax=Triticum dicoccoides TaxID=85692 RepID=UPI00188E240A|nr:ribosomal lysine N-methyltransferase 4-like isoform X3 [Triticum dicoccoides]
MAAVVVRRRLALAGAPLLPTYRQLAAAAIPIPIPKVNEDEHSGAFLRWLRSKAGSGISSVLRIGTSPLGRSLFASQPIQEGDCILQLPHTAQLTQDKLPREVRLLLDDDAAVAGDTAAKVAVLLMMEQRLGHESGWAPYVTSLPAKDQMHNMMFWDLDELDMVRHSPVYDEAIKQKEQVRKQFSAAKPALEHFPHLFEEIKLEDFMHSSALVSSRAWQTSRGVSLVPFADFLNHDGASDSILVYDEEKAVSEVIADRNYAVGEQAHIWIDMSEQDPLYKKKLDIWEKHRTPKSQHMCSSGCARTSFAIKEVKCSGNKGVGIPQALRAFVRIFCATSIEELEEMTVEAAENDGRLARRPLKHAEGEVHAHRKLLLHLDNMIQGHSTAIEQLETIDGAASRSMHPFRKEMAKNLLAGELQILQSAYAWVANYCKTVACT